MRPNLGFERRWRMRGKSNTYRSCLLTEVLVLASLEERTLFEIKSWSVAVHSCISFLHFDIRFLKNRVQVLGFPPKHQQGMRWFWNIIQPTERVLDTHCYDYRCRYVSVTWRITIRNLQSATLFALPLGLSWIHYFLPILDSMACHERWHQRDVPLPRQPSRYRN